MPPKCPYCNVELEYEERLDSEYYGASMLTDGQDIVHGVSKSSTGQKFIPVQNMKNSKK